MINLRLHLPVRHHVYVGLGAMLASEATDFRYRRSTGSGVTLRLLRIVGRYAVLVQTFRH